MEYSLIKEITYFAKEHSYWAFSVGVTLFLAWGGYLDMRNRKKKNNLSSSIHKQSLESRAVKKQIL